MRTLTRTLSLALVLGLGLGGRAAAEIIGADDFSETDGSALGGKAADVGGTWSSNGQINGGAFDTAQFGGAHDGSFVGFTRALGAGETLIMTFETFDTGGTMFQPNNNYAGISLYLDNDEKFFVGDPAGGADAAGTGWTADGFAGGSGAVISTINAEAVTGVFTYNFDSGNASLTLNDGASSETVYRTYDPGVAVNRLRIQAGDGLAEINVSSFEVSAVPEPASAGLMALALAGLAMQVRKRLA
ncbi:MAG: PEP-CTERM sorting domain-containing protein [Planctomycetales bacterium]|nr:PEP-CTERM sorting domain-containing protein [Planctomycetales bacterium]